MPAGRRRPLGRHLALPHQQPREPTSWQRQERANNSATVWATQGLNSL